MVERRSVFFVDDLDPMFLESHHIQTEIPDPAPYCEANQIELMQAQGIVRPELRTLWTAPCIVNIHRFDQEIWLNRYNLCTTLTEYQQSRDASIDHNRTLMAKGELFWTMSLVEDGSGPRLIFDQKSAAREATVAEIGLKHMIRVKDERGARLLWLITADDPGQDHLLHFTTINQLRAGMQEWINAMDGHRPPKASS